MMGRFKELIFVLSLTFFCLSLTGCNREARDKLLRTFFDGVPPPEAERPVMTKVEEKEEVEKAKTDIALPQRPTLFFHRPFSEGQCDVCHNAEASQGLILQGKELCFTCHDDFTEGKEVVHYPVNEGACTECHNPHQSQNRYILKEPVPEICFTCHDEEDIKANPVHEGQDICTLCHNVHASDEEKLFK